MASEKLTLTLAPDEADILRGCLAERLHAQSEVIVSEVGNSLGGGSGLGLADAAWKVRDNAKITAMLERLGEGPLN